MRDRHKWEELLPEEFYAEFERVPIGYFACGAMEDHGLHNALGTDMSLGYEICLRAVRRSGGILFPPIPFAPAGIPGLSREELRSGRHQLFPPSLWSSRELCKAIYLEVMESMADIGFRVCVTVGGHYPAGLVLREIDAELGGRLSGMRILTGEQPEFRPAVELEYRERDPRVMGHGTMWETSQVLAVNPDLADPPRSARTFETPIPSQLKDNPPEVIARIPEANTALGSRILDETAALLADEARRLLTADRS
jgi:creatinine amidohydrolase/Fe(II)-dependent formamide hydrolase-like protein